MDIKNKLEGTYLPDKKTQKEKVLIALSGGIDSYVTAYLLKIQKYDLVAVTVANTWEDYTGDSDKILSCHVNQTKLDEIKSFCNKMGIPHQMVKESSRFKEKVVENWMADKILGKLPNQCWDCHDLRMHILHEKMKENKASRMATGHYAKLFRHETHNTVFVHTSNDDENDQSGLLSRLSHDILNSLILPLSDLTKSEVLKLADNFGVNEKNIKLEFDECLRWNDTLNEVFLKNVPKKLLKEGEITNPDGTQTYGQHEGVFEYTFGEDFNFKESGKSITGHFGAFAYPEKRLIIVKDDYFLKDKILLVHCHFSEEVNWPEPMKGVVLTSNNEFIDCWIHPKSLSSVYLELERKHKFIPGQIISLLKKKGKNSKIYLTGEIQELPAPELDPEGVELPPKVNYTTDF